MNILWIDHPSRYNRFDDWLHFKFAKAFREFCNIYFYGPEIHKKCPEMTPIGYKPDITLKELTERLNLDIVVLDSKASAYDEYYPAMLFPGRNGGEGVETLPYDFATFNGVKKVCIEEDFHYEPNCKWHVDKGFQFIFQRHYCQAIRELELPFHFLPFSVDTNYFKPLGLSRKPAIGLAGTNGARNYVCRESVYLFREHAARALTEASVIAESSTLNHDRYEHEEYIEYLNSYMGHLCCGSLFGITPAKMFEIMASGSVLFMNHVKGLDLLFDKGSYVEYVPCTNDIINKARQVIGNNNYRAKIVECALDCIRRKHTHVVRIKQFFSVLGVEI